MRADCKLSEQQSRLMHCKGRAHRSVRTDPGAPSRTGGRPAQEPQVHPRIPHIKHGARSSVAACCGDGETNDHTGVGPPTPQVARAATRLARPHQLHANYAFFLETKKRSSARTRP